jgi:glycosyltransferase involved in cell wall biosynthesis
VKILLISPTFSGIGGIAQHVRGLNQYLRDSGNQVNVLSSDNSFTIPFKGLKNPSFMISSSLKTKFMKKYDVIHAHNIPSAKAMKNAKGKKILSLHGIFSEQVNMLHGKTTGNISKKYETDALQWADAITVVSKEAKEYYKKLGYDVFHIPNAINLKQIPKQGEKLYANQIIFAGRISKEKGIIELLEMLDKIPKDIHLVIVGKGPEEKLVREKITKFENCHYMGYQSHENTLKLIKGSDLLIQPSLTEGISSTILESMACETPIIASKIGGNLELIKNKKNGLLIDPKNDFSSIVLNLLYDKEQSSQFRHESLKILSNYSWERVGKSYYELYQSLLV